MSGDSLVVAICWRSCDDGIQWEAREAPEHRFCIARVIPLQ